MPRKDLVSQGLEAWPKGARIDFLNEVFQPYLAIDGLNGSRNAKTNLVIRLPANGVSGFFASLQRHSIFLTEEQPFKSVKTPQALLTQ